MPALHLMTFNVQCLPRAVSLYNGMSDDAVSRANRVCTELLHLRDHERPDVIALQEVFSEDARAVFRGRLLSRWPHLIDEVDQTKVGKVDDSGLMLFSRLPLLTLPTGEKVLTAFYEDAAGADAVAPKAVAIVCISAPDEVTTIAFTHMQASYDSEEQHREIRARQFATINDALHGLLGNGNAWGSTILVGDLNVRGDPGATSDEWADTFVNAPPALFTRLLDGWSEYMHPPNDITQHDPGFTNKTPSTGAQQRLDYACFPREGTHGHQLVPHHMFTRLRSLSDHYGLECIVQRSSPYCTPSDALDVLAKGAFSGGTDSLPSIARTFDVTFDRDGTLQWLFVGESGTFSVFSGDPDSKPLNIRVFEIDNLSTPLESVGTINANDLAKQLQLASLDIHVDPKGQTFAPNKKFFVAVRAANRRPGRGKVVILKHLGESRETAIVLTPHHTHDTSFPAGKPLGDKDMCWFKAVMPQTYSDDLRPETFKLLNASGTLMRFMLETDGLGKPDEKENAEPELVIMHETRGLTTNDLAETVFLKLLRRDRKATGFQVRWECPLSFLMLEEPMGFYVDDESGIDVFGDDEIELDVGVDSEPLPLFSAKWDYADTGEEWAGLAEAIRRRAREHMRIPGVKRMGFLRELSIMYYESGWSAGSPQLKSLLALAPQEPEQKERRVSLPVSDSLADGSYTFYCWLTKVP